MRRSFVVVTLFAAAAAARAQSVISVRSGLVNCSEGAVFIDNQLVTPKLGTYPTLREGSDLLTEDGRAEILLTPENYLRVGINSAVRMVSSGLGDTQVQLLHGSVIFDSGNAKAGAPITLIASDARIRIDKPSRLRIDTDPPQIRIEKGAAEVTGKGGTVNVGTDQMLALDGATVVRRMSDESDDSLDLWSQQRNRTIYLSSVTNHNILDPGSADYDANFGSMDPGIGSWLGYMPPAAILPLTGSYATVGLASGYGYYPYYTPFSTLAYYGPVFGLYRNVYGAGVYSPIRYGSSIIPGYRSPLYPGAVYPGTTSGIGGVRPSGGIRIGMPASGSGISLPRPVGIGIGAHPITPHAPVRR